MNSGIERRLRRLEGMMTTDDGDLSDLSYVEIDMAHEAILRSIAENLDTPDERRQEARDELAEVDGERQKRAAFYGRPDIAAAIESNRAAGHIGAECTCDALPYFHKPHRPTGELVARLVACVRAREGADA
jgi:hypothetical protein